MLCARQHEDFSECLYLKVFLRSVVLVLDDDDEEEVGVLRVPKCCPPKLPRRLEDRCCPSTYNTAQTLQVPTFTSSHQRKSIPEEIISDVIRVLRRVLRLSDNQRVARRTKLLPPSSGYKITRSVQASVRDMLSVSSSRRRVT